MKVIAYVLFAFIVLLVSGLARAQSLDALYSPHAEEVKIERVFIDQQLLTLAIESKLPNPCYEEPKATMVSDEKEAQTLIINLTTTPPKTNCISRVQKPITFVSIRSLAAQADFDLDSKIRYTIKIKNYPFQIDLWGAQLIE